MSAPTVSGEVSRVSMRAKMPTRVLPFKRHFTGLPYQRLAQELGYARVKTARDTVARPYHQVAITNRVLIESGHPEKACELMAVVDASMLPEVPDLGEAIHRHNKADALEDVEQSEFIRTAGDAELAGWITKLATDLRHGETLLAALVRERDERKAGR